MFDVANDIRETRQISSETLGLARKLHRRHADYLRAGTRDAVLRRAELGNMAASGYCGHSLEKIVDGSGNGVRVSDDTI